MWLELLNFVLGIAFGFFHHGREDLKGLLKNGTIAGIALGLIFVIISMFLAPGSISVGAGFLGAADIFLVIIIFVIIFIAGAFIGDRLEGLIRK